MGGPLICIRKLEISKVSQKDVDTRRLGILFLLDVRSVDLEQQSNRDVFETNALFFNITAKSWKL